MLRFVKTILSVLGAGSFATCLYGAAELRVGPVPVPTQGIATIPLSLQADSEVTAFQVDISVPATLFSGQSLEKGPNLLFHEAVFSEFAPGMYRIVVYSLFNEPIPNGFVLNLVGSVPDAAAKGTVTLANPTLATATATALPNVSIVPGTLSLVNARLSAFKLLAGGKFEVQLSGLAGSSYTLESSTDLRNWSQVETRVVTSSSATFTGTLPANNRYLFYRVRFP